MPDKLINDTLLNALLITAQFIVVYLAILWACVAYWAYKDARRRSPDIAIALASAALVFFFFLPGYWVYLLVRPRLTIAEVSEERARQLLLAEYMRQCPSCSATVTNEYVVCPRCRTRLKATCTSCAKPVEPSWVACAYCASVISIDQPTAPVVTPEIAVGEPAHA